MYVLHQAFTIDSPICHSNCLVQFIYCFYQVLCFNYHLILDWPRILHMFQLLPHYCVVIFCFMNQHFMLHLLLGFRKVLYVLVLVTVVLEISISLAVHSVNVAILRILSIYFSLVPQAIIQLQIRVIKGVCCHINLILQFNDKLKDVVLFLRALGLVSLIKVGHY